MAYKTINWKDHVVEHPLRRTIKEIEDGYYIVKPEVGEIIQKGTKQSAQNFNHMDEGILDAHIAAQIMLQNGLHGGSNKQDYNEPSEATYEDIQNLVGEIWDAPYEPPRPEAASEDGIRGLFK